MSASMATEHANESSHLEHQQNAGAEEAQEEGGHVYAMPIAQIAVGVVWTCMCVGVAGGGGGGGGGRAGVLAR